MVRKTKKIIEEKQEIIIEEKQEEPIQDNFLSDMENTMSLEINEIVDDSLSELENDNDSVNNKVEEPKHEQIDLKIGSNASDILNKIIFERNEKKEPKPKQLKEKNNDGSSELLGYEVRGLLDKVNKYKALFPEKLKDFKLKNKLTSEYLKSVLTEFEAIIETDNVDNFITEGFILCLKQVEGITSNYKRYNITGMSDMLKQNPQFHKVMKQLYLKYNVFSSVPPEHQLLMIIFTTSYVAIEKNKRKEEINNYLNEPFVEKME